MRDNEAQLKALQTFPPATPAAGTGVMEGLEQERLHPPGGDAGARGAASPMQ